MDEDGEFFDLAPQVDPWLDPQRGKIEDEPADTAFYRELAENVPGPALELGVGTGRIYLELIDIGLDVDGIDVSERSLAQLIEHAEARELDPTVWTANMTELDVDRQYGLIYAPARAFNHLSRLTDQRAALEKIYKGLKPDGTFALNTFVPKYEFVVESYGQPVEEEVTLEGNRYRIVTTSYLENEIEQVTRIHRELYRNGELVAERETLLAQIPKRQFELLFELTGFSDWSTYGGFNYEPLGSADQEMVLLAQK